MALYARGRVWDISGQPQQALDCYRNALKLDPDRACILDHLCGLLASQQRADEAIALLERSLQQNPKQPALWHRLGRLYTGMEQWQPALTAFTRAMELSPNDPELLLGLAALKEADGRRDEVIPLLRRAADNHVQTIRMVQTAGRIYLDPRTSTETRAKAEALILDLSSLSAPGIESVLLAAEIFFRAGRPDRILPLLEHAQANAPDDPEIRFELASAWIRSGREDRAIPILAELSRGPPAESIPALKMLASIYAGRLERDPVPGPEDPSRASLLDVLNRLLESHPEDPGARTQLAGLFFLLNRIEEGFQILRDTAPDNPGYRQHIGVWLAREDPSAPARGWLLARAQATPSDTWVCHTLGEIELASGRTAEARPWFSKAVQAPAPAIPTFLRESWLALIQDADPEQAEQILQRGLTLYPSDVHLLEARSNLALFQKDPATAADWLDRAVEASPQQPASGAVLAQLALLRAFAGRTESALEAVDRALHEDPFLIETISGQASFWAPRLNMKDPPRILLDRAMKRFPENPICPLNAGLYEFQVENYERALSLFEAAHTMALANPAPEEWLTATFYFWRGAACDKTGKYDLAETCFEHCLELDPDHAQALNYLAYMWAEQNRNLDRALEDVRKALTLEPDEPAFLDTLGWILFRKGDFAAALEPLLRAAEQTPDEAEVLCHVARTLNGLGRDADALEYWKKAYIADPEYGPSRDRLTESGVDPNTLQDKVESARKKREWNALMGEESPSEEPEGETSDHPIPGLDLTNEELERLNDPLVPFP